MLEQAKTILLILLVASSMLLTWKTWTYQPHYDYINPTEYIDHEGLAEKKEINELIRPELIIYHYGNQKHTISYPEMFQYRIIQGQMPSWYFYEFREVVPAQYESWQNLINIHEGIELSFPTGIPIQFIQEIFQIRTDNNLILPLINRIWIYKDESNEDVYAMFISEAEQKMLRARTSLSVGELRNYLSLGENRPNHEAFVFSRQAEGEIYPIYYLPTVKTEMTEYRYFYNRVPIDTMIQYLFVDPTLVRQIKDRSGGTFYTDGSRGLHYDQSLFTMYYLHPVAQYFTTEERSASYVQRSVQFVNQHKGFDAFYYLYDINNDLQEQKVTVQFRKYAGNFPIFSTEQEGDQNVIQLEVQHDRVVGYHRPMFEFDRVIEQVKRELPSGLQIIEHLNLEGIRLEMIESISLGYKINIQDYFLNYIPSWVIQFKNGERLFITEVQEITHEIDNSVDGTGRVEEGNEKENGKEEANDIVDVEDAEVNEDMAEVEKSGEDVEVVEEENER
jgi:regulatory protein YycH of two-component signal transduction system YycFG